MGEAELVHCRLSEHCGIEHLVCLLPLGGEADAVERTELRINLDVRSEPEVKAARPCTIAICLRQSA